jgi:hypothetical protein
MVHFQSGFHWKIITRRLMMTVEELAQIIFDCHRQTVLEQDKVTIKNWPEIFPSIKKSWVQHAKGYLDKLNLISTAREWANEEYNQSSMILTEEEYKVREQYWERYFELVQETISNRIPDATKIYMLKQSKIKFIVCGAPKDGIINIQYIGKSDCIQLTVKDLNTEAIVV